MRWSQSLAAGVCDIGLGNTYYVGLMRKDETQRAWAEAIKVIMPTFGDSGGTHVNISGLVVAKYAPNRDNAVKLAEFLVSDKAQEIYAEANYEYPVRDDIKLSETVASFGVLKPDTLPLATIATHRKTASEMVDEVGFDN